MNKMAGRPTSHNPEIEAEIFERLSLGESLRGICRSPHLPSDASVRRWIVSDKPSGISLRYACARASGLDALAEEILDISDDGSNDWMEREGKDGSVETILNSEHINRSRLRVDARKWLLSKMAPKKYGDRIEIAGDKENPLEVNIGGVELLKTRISSLIARGTTDDPTPGSD